MSRTGNVKVAFRLRPLSKTTEKDYGCVQVDRERGEVSVRNTDGTHHFIVDQVYDDNESQSHVYKESASSFVSDFIAGRNCCLLAYGELGSGKTHTMLGENLADPPDIPDDRSGVSSLGSAGVSRFAGKSGKAGKALPPPEQILARRGVKHAPPRRTFDEEKSIGGMGDSTPLHIITEDSGIVPRAVKNIFDVLRKRRRKHGDANDDPKLSFSYVEIYNERIIDLLDLEGPENTGDDHSLSIRSNPDQGVYVEDAIEIECRDEEDVSAALEVAYAVREKRFQNTGIDNSKAHAVLILKLERYSKSRGKRATSNLFLVDLANSGLVRRPPPGANDRAVAEARSVKRSLGALRKCIRALALQQRSPAPPFGESVLTKLLHNALTRGSGIHILVTGNPVFRSVQETLSALRFGTYVAGQRSEEVDESDRYSSAARRSSGEITAPRIKTGHHQNGVRAPESMGVIPEASGHGKPDTSYEELETAGEILRKLPPSANRNENGKHHPNGNGVAGDKELSQVSNLLDIAAKKMEADLTDAQDELKGSGDEQSVTAAEMEKQLLAVTKELETMKYDGHLAVQIQNDLLAAQEELKRLTMAESETSATPTEPARRASSNLAMHLEKEKEVALRGGSAGREEQRVYMNGQRSHCSAPGNDVEKMRAELQEMRRSNEMLTRQHAAKSQELATARQEIEALKAEKKGGTTEVDEFPQIIDPMNFSAVSNKIPNDDELAIVKKKTDDWDEKRVEVGPEPVCVCLRLRPMTKLERNRRSRSCIEVHEGGREFTVDSPLDGEYDFCFDNVFDIESTQEDVYETVGAPIVDQLLGGINCAVMVYGLTGSGKSHTLAGKLPEMRDEHDDESSDDDSAGTERTPTEQDAGFSPRLVADLFRGMKDSPSSVEYRITCSYVCIYLEKLFDLLDPRFDKCLIVRDTTNGIKIEGAVEAFCFDEEDIIHLIRRGAACRKLIGNKLTMDHNRSHSLLILNIEQTHIHSGRVRRSYLKLVELAGFEVTSKAKGQSMQETKIIHKSFSALGNVIKSLTEGSPFAPYRESKLTSLLKEALGGNCKTTLFITASPSSYHISETINSIRLGQRVRRVTNKPRVNIDASDEDYRTWLLETEGKLGELASLVQQLAKEFLQASEKDSSVQSSFSESIWESIQAIANDEESKANPCRRALIMDGEEFLDEGQQKWRALTIELARRLPSERLEEIRAERNRAQSILSDIQSESVVLRRQNELLVLEKRKKEEELASAYRENRKMTMENSEITHKLTLAENRAKEAVIFLRYLRTLCFKLRKDVERDRPIDISEITVHLEGAPDLSGLVDFDTMMVENGFIHTKEVLIERVETEYFDYLQQAGLIIDEEQVAAEDEVDELAFLDDGIGSVVSDNRWKKAQNNRVRVDWVPDQSLAGSHEEESRASTSNHDTFLGLQLPWVAAKKEEPQPRHNERMQHYGVRNTRRERELQRDLQNMANKCVELQMELNVQRQLMESLTNKASTLKMKKLSQEVLNLSKERDRMMHNAKAATWKLQELHVVNKLLSKQGATAKQQITFLEEGFQRLQESFRGTVQEGLDADQSLRDRVKALQSIVDSLTGPAVHDDSDEDSEDDSFGSANPLVARVHLPLRGRVAEKPSLSLGTLALVDPSGPHSRRHCLLLHHRGKRGKKKPSLFSHHSGKVVRKSSKFGTALIGENREKLKRAYMAGQMMVPPLFLDEEEDDDSAYTEDDEGYYDDE